MQSLRFISEAAQDMTAARSLFGRADTESKAVPAADTDSEADEADFFETASPDTRSEASHYHDCHSEGMCVQQCGCSQLAQFQALLLLMQVLAAAALHR